MSKKHTLFFLCLLSNLLAFSQSIKLSGKVINEKNEPVAGASIQVVGISGGTTTNGEGSYVLSLAAGKKYELTVSAVGYAGKSISDVEVVSGGINELNIVLERAAKSLEAVVVSTRRVSARLESVNAAIAFQRNTNTIAAVVSAETIRRSPDKNTGEVLKRTPGASLQDGKFLVVRGLADRYNQAMLNGILLASTEPDRKSFSFDLIPAPMIDNIIINKAFVPELPGEWAGGLVQINTKDIPAANFFNIQVGVGLNTQSISNDFYGYKGGKYDWLGFDDGTRNLPDAYGTKTHFNNLSPARKNEIGKQMQNVWTAEKMSVPLNTNFQVSGGFNTTVLGGKKLGGIVGLTYNRQYRFVKVRNNGYAFSDDVNIPPSANFEYTDNRYAQEVLAGAMGNLSFQFNNNHRVSAKALFNINATDYVIDRYGIENNGSIPFDSVKGAELGFKQNLFFNSQVSGDHALPMGFKLKWYGSFNVLDAYIPDQRRYLYVKENTTANQPYQLLLANSLSQRSGNRFYQFLNDYIYTAGGDLSFPFTLFNNKQTVKGGYMFQVKDRLFDSKPFSLYLPNDNPAIRAQGPATVFSRDNFGNGDDNKLAIDAIKGDIYRYLANTILNAGYIQFDNQFSDAVRVVWGLRIEDYDQLVGSVKKADPRFSNSRVTDYLPGVNATFRLTPKTNVRLTGSQTVVRPEFRELASFQYYDFELNAAVQGNPGLERTKITNVDLRYELYDKPGEVFTLGVFYKYFDKPIEQIFNIGGGGASTFRFENPDEATAYGAELEVRKKLDFIPAFRNFTFQSNLAYIYSEVKSAALGNLDRPLQGQSPYILNFGLLYDYAPAGWNATVLFNQIGRRIAFVGDEIESPNVWEAPRPILDFQVSKKLFARRGELRLNVSDILNQRNYFYQNVQGSKRLQKSTDKYRFTRQYGTNITLNFSYSF